MEKFIEIKEVGDVMKLKIDEECMSENYEHQLNCEVDFKISENDNKITVVKIHHFNRKTLLHDAEGVCEIIKYSDNEAKYYYESVNHWCESYNKLIELEGTEAEHVIFEKVENLILKELCFTLPVT